MPAREATRGGRGQPAPIGRRLCFGHRVAFQGGVSFISRAERHANRCGPFMRPARIRRDHQSQFGRRNSYGTRGLGPQHQAHGPSQIGPFQAAGIRGIGARRRGDDGRVAGRVHGAGASGRRGDAFDPAQNPNAPGAPHVLGSTGAPPAVGARAEEQPVGAPGGRGAGAPLDLATIAPPGAPLPGLPPRNAGASAATLPLSQTPRDEYDLAYGYVLRKDYALAEDGFRGFLSKYPSDRLAGDANYWLGESLFQRQRFRDAAEAFLNVSTKYESSGKAPDALLRLGQSLAALGEKEAACASLGEVLRKYPRASAGVKQGVEREQKRVRC